MRIYLKISFKRSGGHGGVMAHLGHRHDPSNRETVALSHMTQCNQEQGPEMVIHHPHTIKPCHATKLGKEFLLIIMSIIFMIMIMTRDAMPVSNGAPIDSVDSSFGLTTPRGYSGAKEVFHHCHHHHHHYSQYQNYSKRILGR